MSESEHPGYPYPVQLDLQGHRVDAYDFFGRPIYRQREQMRNFRPHDTDKEQVSDT